MNKKRIVSLLTFLFVLVSMSTVAFATGEAAPAAANGEGIPVAGIFGSPIFMIVIMIAVFYFFIIRPENKRKKETANMRNSLKVGDEITTIGGIVGRVVKVKDEELTIETGSDKNKLRIMKWAVSTVNSKNEKKASKNETSNESSESETSVETEEK